MWLTGIDEAGYGPLLGPLVVTAVTFEVPDGSAPPDLWAVLASAVARPGGAHAGRLPVGDSKQLFSQARGLAAVELACLAFAEQLPHSGEHSLLSLLQTVGADLGDLEFDGPWHRDLSRRLPVGCSKPRLDEHSAALALSLEAAHMRLHSIRSAVVPPSAFNMLVTATGNKADCLGDLCSSLYLEVLNLPGTHWLAIDKHGGRHYYAAHLLSCGLRLCSATESPERSAYGLALGHGGKGTIEFAEGGDRKHFAVGLASMFSKYLRELLMMQLNAWWQERVPDLKPTAGYAADAKRFLNDIEAARSREGIELGRIVREK